MPPGRRKRKVAEMPRYGGISPAHSPFPSRRGLLRREDEQESDMKFFVPQNENAMSGLCFDEPVGDQGRRKAPVLLRAPFHEEQDSPALWNIAIVPFAHSTCNFVGAKYTHCVFALRGKNFISLPCSSSSTQSRLCAVGNDGVRNDEGRNDKGENDEEECRQPYAAIRASALPRQR